MSEPRHEYDQVVRLPTAVRITFGVVVALTAFVVSGLGVLILLKAPANDDEPLASLFFGILTALLGLACAYLSVRLFRHGDETTTVVSPFGVRLAGWFALAFAAFMAVPALMDRNWDLVEEVLGVASMGVVMIATGHRWSRSRGSVVGN